MIDDFFKQQTDQSRVKTAIVSKYFNAWATIMATRSAADKICYIDFFSGPGLYADGSLSTPLIVTSMVLENPKLKSIVQLIFNDSDNHNIEKLQVALHNASNINSLKYPPAFWNVDAGQSLADEFKKIKMAPSLVFIDPWGYRGLSIDLISSMTKDWGSDGIVFFNYNRVNMGLSNPTVSHHMLKLFGPERLPAVLEKIRDAGPDERELTIVDEFGGAIADAVGTRYVLPFRFIEESRDRTSHYLYFISKHPLGYVIMKNIMAKESERDQDSVPSFEYSPATPRQQLLFLFVRKLNNLKDDLIAAFAGRTAKMIDIFEEHHVGTPFIEKNYKTALMELEKENRIFAEPNAKNRKKNTFADRVVVSFPEIR
ncbi:MAG: three-Cys-motif partner protein TcmP [Deltaproteobacteria bacterium]|nr:three-Cys-motif partner protein TcmP [Deltaproteobacteria bacterium]